MSDEKLTIGELGGYTNNLPNKEGIKKLLKKIDEGGAFDPTEYYDKTATDTLLDDKQDVLTAGDNITIVDNVISATGGGSEDWAYYYNANNYSVISPDFYEYNSGYYYLKRDVRVVIQRGTATKGVILYDIVMYKGERLSDRFLYLFDAPPVDTPIQRIDIFSNFTNPGSSIIQGPALSIYEQNDGKRCVISLWINSQITARILTPTSSDINQIYKAVMIRGE